VTGNAKHLAHAVLAGGCFWCLEPVFRELRGVLSVESGYTGGQTPDPDYDQVCSGETGHAEAVRIAFDPEEISYRQLLGIFFAIHDPTTKDRQGLDAGTQYRSAIFTVDEEQRREALDVIAGLSAVSAGPGLHAAGRAPRGYPSGAPIVTEVSPLTGWYPAESWHQRFYERNPGQPYCSAVIAPKLAKFRREFAALRADTGADTAAPGSAER